MHYQIHCHVRSISFQYYRSYQKAKWTCKKEISSCRSCSWS